MSSSPTTAAAGERQTYWCHECEMSVSSLSTTVATHPLRCPYCHSDFLEQMDSPLSNNPNPNPNPIPTQSTPSDDDLLLRDNPFLQRLIRALAYSRESSPPSKTDIEAIPTVVITESLLSPDPIIICAVCIEQFVIDDQTKQLPCKHLYHPDCILPWLVHHNTCPVCRFELPVCPGRADWIRRQRRGLRSGGELVESDAEMFGYERGTLRNMGRRHGIEFLHDRWTVGTGWRARDAEGNHMGEEESLFSPTQIAEDGWMAAQAHSVETAQRIDDWFSGSLGS